MEVIAYDLSGAHRIIFFGFAVYNLTCAFVDIPDQEDLTNDDALPQTAGHQK